MGPECLGDFQTVAYGRDTEIANVSFHILFLERQSQCSQRNMNKLHWDLIDQVPPSEGQTLMLESTVLLWKLRSKSSRWRSLYKFPTGQAGCPPQWRSVMKDAYLDAGGQCTCCGVRLLRLAARPSDKWPIRVQPATACALGLVGKQNGPGIAKALNLVWYLRLVSMSVLFLDLLFSHITSSGGVLLGLPARKKKGKEKGQ